MIKSRRRNHHARRRAVIIETWNHTPHLEIGIEIALRYADSGASVDYHFIGHLLPYVQSFLRPSFAQHKAQIIEPQANAIRLAKSHLKNKKHNATFTYPKRLLKCNNHIKGKLLDDLARLNNLEDLKTIRVKDRNCGPYLYSSLIEATAESNPDIQANMSLIKDMALSWLLSYTYMSDIISKRNVGSVILFNGRFSCVGGAREACLENDIKILYHERGGSPERFSLYNFRPHEQEKAQSHMLSRWKIEMALDSKNAIAKGSSFYHKKLDGDGLRWFSFKYNNSKTYLDYINCASKTRDPIIVYFQSSDDEFAGIEECRPNTGYRDQFAGVRDLSLACKKYQLALVIRMHPNMKDKLNDSKRWELFAQEIQARYIGPNDNEDSYELILKARASVVYHSTIGAEAAFLGRWILCLGPSFYNLLIPSIRIASTFQDIDTFLSLSSSSQTNINMQEVCSYGYAALYYGIRLRYVKIEEVFKARLLNTYLDAPPLQHFSRRYINAAKMFIHKFRIAAR